MNVFVENSAFYTQAAEKSGKIARKCRVEACPQGINSRILQEILQKNVEKIKTVAENS